MSLTPAPPAGWEIDGEPEPVRTAADLVPCRTHDCGFTACTRCKYHEVDCCCPTAESAPPEDWWLVVGDRAWPLAPAGTWDGGAEDSEPQHAAADGASPEEVRRLLRRALQRVDSLERQLERAKASAAELQAQAESLPGPPAHRFASRTHELCCRCEERQRHRGGSWCRECTNAYQRARSARLRDGTWNAGDRGKFSGWLKYASVPTPRRPYERLGMAGHEVPCKTCPTRSVLTRSAAWQADHRCKECKRRGAQPAAPEADNEPSELCPSAAQ